MKVLMINVVCGTGSTGRICTDLAGVLEQKGHIVKIAYGRDDVPKEYQKYAVRIGNDADVRLHVIKARLFDAAGFGSKVATENFVEWIKEYNPDVIHLHNIHGYYINVEVLFDYLKTCGKEIIWTLHDCWPFTGHCSHFEMQGCTKWKTQCQKCPQSDAYPKSYLDNSLRNYRLKKKCFSGINNLTIVTPSEWLANYVKQSFLKVHQIVTIHNGIDTKVFKDTKTNIFDRYGCSNKKVILGVAAPWTKTKGLSDFIELSKLLTDEFQIFLVGLNDAQIKALPQNIIGIKHTFDVQELVKLYSASYLFVNATYEDNYPTVNLEAQSCGVPVITYNTGGSIESVNAENVVEQGNIELIAYKIMNEEFEVKKDVSFDKGTMIKQYMDLYKKMLNFNNQ